MLPMSDSTDTNKADADKVVATAAESNGGAPNVSFGSFQRLIREMYYEKDVARGIPATFLWLTEEFGELASALRETTDEEKDRVPAGEFAKRRENLQQEFADVLAWLATIANVAGVDLGQAINQKYGSGCPGCRHFVCECPDEEKP